MLGCNLSHPGSTITIDPQPRKASMEKKNYMDDQQPRGNYTQQDDQNNDFDAG